jgi:hypothetical protein
LACLVILQLLAFGCPLLQLMLTYSLSKNEERMIFS